VRFPSFLLFFRKIFKKLFFTLDQNLIKDRKEKRQTKVSDLVGVNIASLGKAHHPRTYLDVWILPEDWRTEQVLNKPAILRVAGVAPDWRISTFFERAARCAVKIA